MGVRMPNVGIPVTVRLPDFPGGTSFQPTWQTTISPDMSDTESFTEPMTDYMMWALGTGRRIMLTGVVISTDLTVAGTILLHLTDGTELLGPLNFNAQYGERFDVQYTNGILLSPDTEILMTSTVVGSYSVQLVGKVF